MPPYYEGESCTSFMALECLQGYDTQEATRIISIEFVDLNYIAITGSHKYLLRQRQAILSVPDSEALSEGE